MKTIFFILLWGLIASAGAKYTPSKDFDPITDEQEQKEFDDEVDGLIRSVCDYDARLVLANRSLDRQKEIQKISGTVDLTAMNNAGGAIVDVTKLRQQKLDLYKKVMGQDLKNYECED